MLAELLAGEIECRNQVQCTQKSKWILAVTLLHGKHNYDNCSTGILGSKRLSTQFTWISVYMYRVPQVEQNKCIIFTYLAVVQLKENSFLI